MDSGMSYKKGKDNFDYQIIVIKLTPLRVTKNLNQIIIH